MDENSSSGFTELKWELPSFSGCFALKGEAWETMLSNCRSCQRRWLAFILLGMVKGGKRVSSVTSGQLCRLLSTVWKHPQCLNPNSNCILSGTKQISRSLKTSQGRWKGLVCVTSPLLYLDNCPTDSLLYLLDLLYCERCKYQSVQELISGIRVIIILIFIKKHSKTVQINYGTSQCKTNLHNQDRFPNALWIQLNGNRNVWKLLPTTLKVVAFASDVLGEDVHCCISLQDVGPEPQWTLHSPDGEEQEGSHSLHQL